MAMRQMEVRSVQSTFNVVAPWAEVSPEVFDNFNRDKIVRGVSDRLGLPPEWLNTVDTVDQTRDERQKQQEAMQQAEMAREAARVIPDESKERMLKGMGA